MKALTIEELNEALVQMDTLLETFSQKQLLISATHIKRPRPDLSAQKLGKPNPKVSEALTGRKQPHNSIRLKGTKNPHHSEVMSRPCELNGVIYPSMKALRLAVGQGKNGSRSPNVRFITAEEVIVWKKK